MRSVDFQSKVALSWVMSAMRKLLAAVLEKTGITWFFSGVSVELPAYFLPNFRVVEIQNSNGAARKFFSHSGN